MAEDFRSSGALSEPARQPYAVAVTLSAQDVAAVLRDRVPGLGKLKLHKLLYYCQGHHLASTNTPLFPEMLEAWDMGPVVADLWRLENNEGLSRTTTCELTEAQLNTIGYVLSRYGRLTGKDLMRLSHDETPWQMASRRWRSSTIQLDVVREFFLGAGAPEGGEEGVVLDSAAISELVAGAQERREDVLQPDSIEDIKARLAARG